MTATKTKTELYTGTISTDLIQNMEIGQEIKVPSDKYDILRSRVGDVNSAYKLVGQPNRWTTFGRTATLGYVSVTRIN